MSIQESEKLNRLPFLMKPAAKDYLWGGSRLNDDYKFDIPISPFAEAWVCSSHSDGESTAYGVSLSKLLKEHPDWLGQHVLRITKNKAVLPILIKIIDAKDKLSIQVHPDDKYALEKEGELGKTEMWYVLDARPGAELIYGFSQDMSAEKVRSALKSGDIEKYLNHIPIRKDDMFYIEAGTVHAIGGGALIAEVQEASNITYRLYDYDRVDKDGKKRPLHLDDALAVMKLGNSSTPRQPMRVLKYRNGYASELLTRCKYFQVERMLLNTEVQRDLADFQTDCNSFHALLCVDGCGNISWNDSGINFFKGDCLFVPADCLPLKLHGKAQLLNVSC